MARRWTLGSWLAAGGALALAVGAFVWARPRRHSEKPAVPRAAVLESDLSSVPVPAPGDANEVARSQVASESAWVLVDRFENAETEEDEEATRRQILELGADALPPLLHAMREGPERRRTEAAEVYGSIQGASVGACLELLREGAVGVACAALGAMGPRAAAAVPALEEAMARDDWDAGVAAVARWKVTGDPGPSIARFRLALSQPESDGFLVQEVGGLGAAAAPLVPDLVRLLDHEDVWFDALGVLARIGPAAEAAVPRLVEWVREERSRLEAYGTSFYSGPSQRNAPDGAECLVRLGDAGLDALERLLVGAEVDPAEEAVDAWQHVLPSVAERRLVPLLSSGDPVTRARATTALKAHATSIVNGSLEHVAALLEDPDAHVREAAADFGSEALGEGRGVGVLRPRLLGALEDADPRVRAAAAYALSALAREDAAVVEALVARLRDPDADVRRRVAGCLRWAKLGAATTELVAAVKEESEEPHRFDVQALYGKEALSTTDLDSLQSCLEGGDHGLAQEAIFVVEKHRLSTPAVVAALERWARDTTVVGVEAIEALGEVTGNLERAVAGLRRWLVAARPGGNPAGSVDRGWRAFYGLAGMPSDTPGVREAMEEAVATGDLPRSLRAKAEGWLFEHPSVPR